MSLARFFFKYLISVIPAGIIGDPLAIADSIHAFDDDFESFGFSPLVPELRNPYEGGFKINEHSGDGVTAEFRVWYENGGIKLGEEPTPSLYCHIAYSLIFGRTRTGREHKISPLNVFFSKYLEIKVARLVYFIVSNQSDPVPNSQNEVRLARPRVVWNKTESIIPYLSFEISRKDLADVLKGTGSLDQSFETFQRGECHKVLNSTYFRLNDAGLKALKVSKAR